MVDYCSGKVGEVDKRSDDKQKVKDTSGDKERKEVGPGCLCRNVDRSEIDHTPDKEVVGDVEEAVPVPKQYGYGS